MLAEVGRWYGYEFRLADSSIAQQPVTTVLTMGQSAKTLKLLRDLLDVSMTFDGDVITLHPLDTGRAIPNHPTRARPAFSTHTEVGK